MADDGHEIAGQEFSGKTVEEATEEGLARLGLSTAQANVEVISRGSRGIFGIGSEPARVRISRRATSAPPPAPTTTAPTTGVKAEPASAPTHTPVPSAPVENAAQQVEPPSAPVNDSTSPAAAPEARATEAQAPEERVVASAPDARAEDTDDSDAEDTHQSGAQSALQDMDEDVDEEELVRLSSELLEQLVRHMGFECTIEGEWREPADDESDRYLHLDIHGNDLGALIGRRGETLASIQYLVRLMINQRIRQWKPIVVDVENYKERRNNQLSQLALRMAEQVVQSGRAMSLEPMPANERRIIHLTLRDHPEVYTQSSGEGERRKVHIVAKA